MRDTLCATESACWPVDVFERGLTGGSTGQYLARHGGWRIAGVATGTSSGVLDPGTLSHFDADGRADRWRLRHQGNATALRRL